MQWEMFAFISATLFLIAGCVVPAAWLPPLPNDKLLHFAAFAGLSLLAMRLVNNGAELAVWLLALFLAGLGIEIIQSVDPGRRFCWKDLAANTAGICAALICIHVAPDFFPSFFG